MASSLAIAPLPPNVVSRIKSSVSITSLNGVIVELLKNSLDASAKKVDIQVDYSRGSCVVEDDGLGVAPAEFHPSGGLAKLHHTSKHANNTETHGTHGCFLASLAALSLLSITSHHHLHRSHNSMTLSRSQVISRQTPTHEGQLILSLNHGTRVTVRNLFGDMPVRVKQRAIESSEPSRSLKEWDSLRKDVTALILSWVIPVSVTIRELTSNIKTKVLRINSRQSGIDDDVAFISHICSIISQASFISSPDTSPWVSARGSTSTMSIKSGISLDPAPTKNIQFISFGIHPLSNTDGRNILFEEINRLFANSSFGKVDDIPVLDEAEKKRRAEDRRYKGDGFTNKELKGSGKGVDRWPMFYVRIDIHSTKSDHDIVEDIFEDTKTLTSITKLLQAVIVEFLKSHNFTTKFVRAAGRSPSKRKIEEPSGSSTIPISATAHSQSPTSTGTSRKASLIKDSPRTSGKSPTRRSTPKSASPFDIWPRVKSGRVPTNATTSKTDLSTVNEQHHENHPSGQDSIEYNDTGAERDSLGIEKSKSRISTPLISKSGTVSQLPFNEVAKPVRQSTTPKAQVPLNETPLEIEKDKLIPWMDPLTKQYCYVNERTGLVQQKDQPKTESGSFTSGISHRFRTLPKTYGSTIQKDLPELRPQPSEWVNDILSTWNNPIFPSVEPSFPQIQPIRANMDSQGILHGHKHTCTQAATDRAFDVSSVGITGRLSKFGLRNACVIAQVDRKFILARMPAESTKGGEAGGDMLVIIDQHAADERCRIEALMVDFCQPPLSELRCPGQDDILPGVRTERLEKSITFEILRPESHRLELHRQHFADWGILYYIVPAKPTRDEKLDRVILTDLPPGIAERCRMDPKLAIELVRKEVWEFDARGSNVSNGRTEEREEVELEENDEGAEPGESRNWLRKMQGCPRGIIEMLNSRACRSAVMFNDVLELRECEDLVMRLGKCKFPFQCAHGRPSMVPLVELGVTKEDRELPLHVAAIAVTAGKDVEELNE